MNSPKARLAVRVGALSRPPQACYDMRAAGIGGQVVLRAGRCHRMDPFRDGHLLGADDEPKLMGTQGEQGEGLPTLHPGCQRGT
jgi:hypothetical protein